MSNRITIGMLESRVNHLNQALGYPTEQWKPYKIDGRLSSNPHHYYIGQAYGGYKLQQIANTRGGAHDISPCGTKREIWAHVTAMIMGVEEASGSSASTINSPERF